MSSADGRSASSDEVERLRQALEELEQDHATGKMSAADYETLRARLLTSYERAARTAAAPPRASARPVEPGGPSARDLDAAAEALIRAVSEERVSCPACGVRPEPAARYCSSCGRHLWPCRSCGAMPSQVGARFCSACGTPLAA